MTLVQLGGFSVKHPFIRFLQWVEDKAYRESDHVVSNLKNAVEHMKSRGMSPKKYTWIPNGFCKDEVSNPQPLSDHVLQQLPNEKFIIGYAGAIGVANALDILIDAAEILKEKQDVAFVLVGDGKEKTNLKALVEQKGLKNVFFVDPIPKAQIQSMLKTFDVCYIGLTGDPLFKLGVSPNKLFDYMASSRPIIYAIDSGAYTPISDAGCGITVPPGDSRKVAEAVVSLKSMPKDALNDMGVNALDFSMAKHEYSQLANRMTELVVAHES
ncbi:hypothetical protein GCM10007160_41700 [Litchfieldella qijiaojingensis]|uniref:Glycosyltransferase n=2 Tax=Litchfieldella qijiaojingensis TaxID=980347 RepID=A0ABQ2ZAB2_9GAMM|nr:hypothetical protein GCM10007160_41700 [Halomonas qijiaojingensis]